MDLKNGRYSSIFVGNVLFVKIEKADKKEVILKGRNSDRIQIKIFYKDIKSFVMDWENVFTKMKIRAKMKIYNKNSLAGSDL